MAKKQETVSMIDSLQEFKDLKNIDKETMINVLEESFRNVIAKMFGTDENYDVIINPEKGDFEIWRNRTVVENGHVSDPNLEVSLRDAQQIDADCTIGEEVTDEVHFADFGRRAILNLRQALASKILELQKDNLTAKYRELIGTIVVADVYQVWKKEVLLLDDEGNELLLPKSEQIPGDFYRKGEAVRAVVQRVETDNNTKIYLSRTDKAFLQRLFEIEVPEINDGLITIRSIARIPGERAKIAVESYDERIDPVGACVGMKGSRIRGIVRELRNENIDVVNYTTNTALYIQRALSPAKVSSIRVDEEEHKAEVFLRPEEVSLAIGKNGLNIKLASMLTDYTIDVFRDIDTADEEDIYLDEFADEVEPWVIEALKEIGCNTAKAVLALAPEEIMERADLEEQTVDDLLRVLSAEFEDEAQPAPDDYAPEEEQPVDEQPVDATDASEPVDEQPAESTDEPDETPTEDEPEEDDADEEADEDTPEVFQEDDTDEKEED
ncbi:transcription elongation factor NusA [Tannerella sp. oral taxon BU063 isolate Cell 8/11]|jgi:transcription termination factor nusA|uniref:Transcription termination/antitermination protein NusA n=1 Tax=Tannerella sp. oral taxon BU063 isolate Cell 8/11 TaxID=1411915 RepID=W2D0X6_9BACT|nr:transcription elongation factor NusA [Tannerella sp. oral taxon BU063 isolate Cell 8/11]